MVNEKEIPPSLKIKRKPAVHKLFIQDQPHVLAIPQGKRGGREIPHPT